MKTHEKTTLLWNNGKKERQEDYLPYICCVFSRCRIVFLLVFISAYKADIGLSLACFHLFLVSVLFTCPSLAFSVELNALEVDEVNRKATFEVPCIHSSLPANLSQPVAHVCSPPSVPSHCRHSHTLSEKRATPSSETLRWICYCLGFALP